MATPVLQVTAPERAALQARLRARALRVEDVRRARVILMLADGQSYVAIQTAVACDARYVSRWRKRFREAGLAGVYSRHRGRAVQRRTPQLEARILALTQQPPPGGRDALEHAHAGGAPAGESHDGRPGLEAGAGAAAPPGALHGIARPGVRGEGR